MCMMMHMELLTEDEVADLLNVKPATLRTWRALNKGPDWHVNPDSGRFIGYTQADLEDWVTAGKREKEH